MMCRFLLRFLFPLLLVPACTGASLQFDVVVYGATAGGAVAAIAAAKGGAKVVLVEPGQHVGGMISGGLGRTDMDRQEHVIGGFSREFFERAGRAYGQPIAWTFEPKIAEKILRDWLAEAGVEVFYGHRLDGVVKEKTRLAALKTKQAEFAASVFIDSSYEGDLLKAAGVSYTYGRESRSLYGELLAGRQEFRPGPHQFRVPLSPYDDDGKLLPYLVREEDLAEVGQGDRKLQAYCFRLCLTTDPSNRIPIPRPADYDAKRYTLVRNYVKALGDSVRLGDFLGSSPIPNQKSDVNASVLSTNLVGGNLDYPDASYERRQEIWREHLNWAHGLLYFLANDPSVPERLRADVSSWGLPKDEFIDTGHWPHQLYVREARRMLGEYVLTQHDLQTRRSKYDSIGMGGYNIDIREVQWVALKVFRFPEVGEEVVMEGYVSMPVEPYEIPYRSLLPQQQECENLLVTSAISASHVAYASFRMEPQYMIVGHAAGAAAAIAVRTGRIVHQVDIRVLQERLKEQRQILSVSR